MPDGPRGTEGAPSPRGNCLSELLYGIANDDLLIAHQGLGPGGPPPLRARVRRRDRHPGVLRAVRRRAEGAKVKVPKAMEAARRTAAGGVGGGGHDRCIVPIRPEHVDAWLSPNPKNLVAKYTILDDRARPYCEHRLAA